MSSISIPKTLQDDRLRFCRVKKGTKKPFELEWTKKPYTWQEIAKFIDENDENYGVLCGFGDLAVLDVDNQDFVHSVNAMFPPTYTVKTGSGGMHYYFFIPELKHKLILESGTLHLGEIQSWGSQCVCPTSIHPNGNRYEEFKVLPIATITMEQLYEWVLPFIKHIQEAKELSDEVKREYPSTYFENEPSVMDIWQPDGYKQRGGEYYGSHPIHGSEGGQNFWVNSLKGLWKCFRCLYHNSKVITPIGIRNIQDIKEGDFVFGRDFQINKVKKTFSRMAKEDIYEIKTYIPKIKATAEHPFYIASVKYKDKHIFKGNPTFSWKQLKDINPKKDFLVIPKKHQQGFNKLDGFELTKELGELLGWYLAEGHLLKRKDRLHSTGIQFTLGLKRTGKKVAKRLCKIAKRLGGTATYNIYPKRGTIIVNTYSIKLYQFIEKYLNTGSKNKHIGYLMQSPLPFLESLVLNYIKGDGGRCYSKKTIQMRVSSVSKTLIREVQIILFKLGIPARYYYQSQKNNDNAKHPKQILQWTLNPINKSEFQDENNLYIPIKIKKVKLKDKRVYNIETEDNTFLLPFITHNCDSGGDWWSAIAVKEGLINCSDAQKGAIRGDVAKRVLQIAQEKYGLKVKPNLDIANKVYERIEQKSKDRATACVPTGSVEQNKTPKASSIVTTITTVTTKENSFFMNADDFNDLRNEVATALLTKDKKLATELIAMAIENRRKIYTTKEDVKSEMWVYDDGVYVPNGKSEVKKIVRLILGEAFTTHFSSEVIAKVEADTYINSSEFFGNNYIDEVPVLNGILNLRTRELKPFNPEQIFFNKLPVHYNPSATCPNIDKHFRDVLKVESDVEVLYEIIGFLLWKEYFIEKAIIFVGNGRNGKGKTLDLIKRFIGVLNCSSVPLSSIREDSFSLSGLFGKMVNLAGDISNTALKETGQFKESTGRDLLNAKRKFLTDLQFVNYAKHIFACNDLPLVYDSSKGFWERWVLFEFPHTFIPKSEYDVYNEQERKERKLKLLDPEHINKIASQEELDGLLIKALDGLDKVRKNKEFSYSIGSDEIKRFWIRKANSFMAFCLDNVEDGDETDYISKPRLRKCFKHYCKKHNVKPSSDKVISGVLVSEYGASDEDYRSEFIRERRWLGVKFQKNSEYA